MIHFFPNLKKIKPEPLSLIIYIFNFIIIGCILAYTILFFLEIKYYLLSKLIIILCLTTLSFKLLYWQSLKGIINSKKINIIDKSKSYLLRIAFCTFTYLTPAYYIFKQHSLVMNDDIILITLIIISLIAFIGIFIERYLFFIDSKNSVNLLNENEFF